MGLEPRGAKVLLEFDLHLPPLPRLLSRDRRSEKGRGTVDYVSEVGDRYRRSKDQDYDGNPTLLLSHLLMVLRQDVGTLSLAKVHKGSCKPSKEGRSHSIYEILSCTTGLSD